jgi:phosphoglycolate phosphatase-like HAD superfamily hydrolase
MARAKAIVFDLDEVLLDTRPAWVYALEEAVVSVSGRRENFRPLVGEYRRRPLRDVLAMLLDSREERERAEMLFTSMYGRSALKKLLVHEGVGMALDHLRSLRVEMAAITRQDHTLAMRQIESTGLDRFFSVLSPTPKGESWVPVARARDCLGYLQYGEALCAYVSGDRPDLEAAASLGLDCYEATWAAVEPTGFPAIPSMARLAKAAAQAV